MITSDATKSVMETRLFFSKPGSTFPTEAECIRACKRYLAEHDTAPADRTPEEQAVIARTIAIDFDDTLAIGLWQPLNPTHEIGPTIESNLAKAKQLIADGWHIIIYTARGWDDEQRIRDWCADHDLAIRDVVCGKPIALSYIDDRACHESESEWGTRRRITEF